MRFNEREKRHTFVNFVVLKSEILPQVPNGFRAGKVLEVDGLCGSKQLLDPFGNVAGVVLGRTFDFGNALQESIVVQGLSYCAVSIVPGSVRQKLSYGNQTRHGPIGSVGQGVEVRRGVLHKGHQTSVAQRIKDAPLSLPVYHHADMIVHVVVGANAPDVVGQAPRGNMGGLCGGQQYISRLQTGQQLGKRQIKGGMSLAFVAVERHEQSQNQYA